MNPTIARLLTGSAMLTVAIAAAVPFAAHTAAAQDGTDTDGQPGTTTSTTAPAADKPRPGSTLPDTIVTASQVPVAPEAVGSAATVVSGERIIDTQTRFAGDMLRQVPGVSVNRSSSFGSVTQIRIRGAEANQTKVLIDGIEANDPAIGSEFDFAHLTGYDIGSIEVLRGPQSALWGSDALSGVIGIQSRRATQPFEAEIVGEGGSFGTGAGSLRLGSAGNGYDVAAAASYVSTQGINIANDGDEEDGYDNLTLSLVGSVQPSDMLELGWAGRYITATNEFDDSDPTLDNTENETDARTALGRVYGKLMLFDGAWEHILSQSILDSARDNDPDGPFSSDTYGQDLQTYYQTNLFFDTLDVAEAAHTVSFKVERSQETFEQKGEVSMFGDPNVEEDATDYGFVGEYRVTLWDSLFLSGALRHDDNELFDNATTWRATAAYLFDGTGTRLHGSYGTGVKNPSFIEIYGFFGDFMGNPDIQPENSRGFDIGVEQQLFGGRAVVDVTYFQQDLKDEIANVFVPDGAGGFIGTVVNLDGESKRNGIEVALGAEIATGLSLNAAYTYLDSEQPDGSTEIRRPKHIASLYTNYDFLEGRANLNLGVEYNGKSYDTDFGVFPSLTRELSDYAVVSVAGSYAVTDNVRLFARAENVFNEDYEEIFGNNTPGLGVFGGVKISFGAP